MSAAGSRYADLVASHAACIISVFVTITGVLTIAGLYLHVDRISNNPQEGFETRGTSLSTNRLTLSELEKLSSSPSELLTLRKFGIAQNEYEFQNKLLTKNENQNYYNHSLLLKRSIKDEKQNNKSLIINFEDKNINLPEDYNCIRVEVTMKQRNLTSILNDTNQFINSVTFSNESYDSFGTKLSADLIFVDRHKTEKFDSNSQEANEQMMNETSDFTTKLPINVSDTIGTNDQLIVNYDDYGVGYKLRIEDFRSTPCTQIFALGNLIPYSSFYNQAKLVFSFKNINEIFDRSNLRILCEIDEFIDTITDDKIHNGVLSFSINLPYYAMCLNEHVNNCSDITDAMALMFRHDIEKCFMNHAQNDQTHPICDTIVIQQLRNLLFSRGFNINYNNPTKTYYLSVILKIINANDNINFYVDLQDKLKQKFRQSALNLMGISFGSKFREEIFKKELIRDTYICTIAIILINASAFSMYGAKGLFLSLMTFVFVALSLGTSFFFYTVLFDVEFFPFINLIVILVAIAIGTDSALLLIHENNVHKAILQQNAERAVNIHANYSMPNTQFDHSFYYAFNVPNHQPSGRNNLPISILAMRLSLRHFIPTVIVMSITTAVAFATNLISDIIVIKCFGLFATLTMLMILFGNITIIPAAYVIYDKITSISICDLFSLNCMKLRYKFLCLIPFIDKIKSINIVAVTNYFTYHLPICIKKWRFVINFFSIVTATCGIIHLSFVIQGIATLPGYRLLRNSHPIEWFFEHQSELLNLTNNDRSNGLKLYAFWGDGTVENLSRFSPGFSLNEFQFRLSTIEEIIIFEKDLREIFNILNNKFGGLNKSTAKNEAIIECCNSPNSNNIIDNNLWLTNFIEWASNLTVDNKCIIQSEKVLIKKEYDTGECFKNYFLRSGYIDTLSSTKISTKWFYDSPLFRSKKALRYYNESPSLMGYFLAINVEFKTSDKINSQIKQIEECEKLIAKFRHAPKFLSIEENLMKAYELEQTLKTELPINVMLSLIICIIIIGVSTRNIQITSCVLLTILVVLIYICVWLNYLGWNMDVVEVTLLVTAIGLSFDFTLHYANAFHSAPLIVKSQRLVYANTIAAHPILVAALMHLCAAAVIYNFASTQAFIRVAQLLFVLTIVSTFGTFILLPSLLTSF